MNDQDDNSRKSIGPTRWTVADARQRFAELIRSAAREPQPIYNRQRLVGVVVDAETFEAFQRWREERAGRSIADALDELRAICQDERYQLEPPVRVDRDNPFGKDPAG